jgi:peroxiredoxin (alkyl hydroperoxide reductase subunit C)
MSLVGKEVLPFKAEAYQDGKFLEVTHEDFKGQWSVVVFYPADFTFVCPTELEDLQSEYDNLNRYSFYSQSLA